MTPYPVAGKRKAAELCFAFIDGAGADGAQCDAAVFYGVDDTNHPAWRECRASGRDWFYIDNSYFDVSRGTHFRVTRNRLQHSGLGTSDGARFKALGIEIKPWRTRGKHLLVCPQSDEFMRVVVGYPEDWTATTVRKLQGRSMSEIRVRHWSRDKLAQSRSLLDDLRDAWALVAYSSAAAVTALLEGVPVFVEDADCAAYAMGSWSLRHIESPRRPEWRECWAAVLADNQWTLDELRDGSAWRALNRV